MRANPVNKNAMALELSQMHKLFNKSVALKKKLHKGHVLCLTDLTVKKPGTGIPAERLTECVGKRLMGDVAADQLLSCKDIEGLDE